MSTPFLLSALEASIPSGSAGNTEPLEYNVRNWQTDDGLPRNTITSIAQTLDGCLWLATYHGLVRFDGLRFTAVEDEEYGPFRRVRPQFLHVDGYGRLWVATATTGIIRYDKDSPQLFGQTEGVGYVGPQGICDDDRGNIWVTGTGGMVYCLVDGQKMITAGPLRQNNLARIFVVRDFRGDVWFAQGNVCGILMDGVATNLTRFPDPITAIHPNRSGGVWLSAADQLHLLQRDLEKTNAVRVSLPFESRQVTCLLEDGLNQVWVGTESRGLYRFARGQFTKELDVTHRLRALCQDAEGNVWVGSEGSGLYRLRPGNFKVVTTKEGLQQAALVSVCEDRDGVIWGVLQGLGLARCRPGQLLEIPEAFAEIKANVVYPHPAGGVWVGTVNRGLLWARENTFTTVVPPAVFPRRQIRVLREDSAGALWVGCLPDGLLQVVGTNVTSLEFFRERGGPQEAIWAITEDRNGVIWLGTIRGELWSYDGQKFQTFGENHGLPGSSIGALHATADGKLWIGTLGGGVGFFHQGKARFANVRNGLPDDVVSAIVEDYAGDFWIASERHIFQLSRRSLEAFTAGQSSTVACAVYGRNDGLASVECAGGYQPAAWRAQSGGLWLATSKGAVTFDPAALPIDRRPPPLELERIVVDGRIVPFAEARTMRSNFRKIEFDYTAYNFTAPDRVLFRRQLVGYDPDWVEAVTSREAIYPRLAPGHYAFRFWACNSDGVWNETPETFAFVVTPAFWQTLWFKVLLAVASGGLIAGLVRLRYVRRMRKRVAELQQAHAVDRERVRIARDIHDDLGAQLTQVALLSEMAAAPAGDDSPAATRLRQIANGCRQATLALEETVWAINPKKDSLPQFVDYLSHFANEFFRTTNIRCRQAQPELIPNLPLTAAVRRHLFLACKEALNNVQRHAEATEVWLRVAVEPEVVIISIEDNGRGCVPTPGIAGGNGLANMQARLAAIGGRCDIESTPNCGTQVRFTIRLSSLPAISGA